MNETANNVKTSFKVHYEISVGRPYELCDAKVAPSISFSFFSFTVMFKFDKIRTTTAADAATTRLTALEVICKPTISFAINNYVK